jgi:hypothetical protein
MVEANPKSDNLVIANMTGKIELQEDSIILNEEFKKNVAIPYFKDIYRDLVTQSDNKTKGINRVTLLSVSISKSSTNHTVKYSQLPGIIGERLFDVMDLKGQGYIDLKEFVHGFFKIYFSNLDTKIRLTFDM